MKRRILSVIIALALCVSLYPTGVLAEESVSGSCTHHTEHTAECGYAEAQPCTHEHTEEKHSTEEEHSGEECYKTVTECVHEHTDECYPEAEEMEESTGEGDATTSDAGNREPSLCTHVCSEESGCITKILDCHHEHDENCGYQEAQDCGYVCKICNGTEPEDTGENTGNTEADDTDTAECICKALCTEDSINGDCSVCGAEGADLSSCKGEKTEVQEVTGEKVITAWEWIDPEEYLTDGILALPGAGRENPAFVEDVTALLPEKIQAKVAAVNAAEDGEETEEDAEAAPETEDAEITLTGWKCASYPEDGAYEGTYTFTAFLPEGFVLAEDAAALEVEVELGGGEMLEGEVSVTYQEASWNGGVTYTTKTADSCTPVADSTTAVTWNAGWYVVNSTVTISEPITVTGAVNLILADGCTLNAEKGIVVETGNSLTIYAQSGGTGTLNATGVFFRNGATYESNASAGIGGSGTAPDSGAITIHGGVINATGGGQSGYCSGAGIGGGTPSSGNGGSSGAVIILGGTVTANSGEGFVAGAGIGGGGSQQGAGGTGDNITIYGGSVTAASTGTQSGGAGIGGGGGKNGGTGSNIQIYGGTIKATGSSFGAGIGGGGSTSSLNSSYKSGDGAVTISGGTVTAVGGDYAAGIGGGGGYYYSTQYTSGGCTGGTGSVTISGGIVDASSPTEVAWEGYEGAPIGNGGNTTAAATVNKTTGIVFENGAGTVCGDVTLDGSYTVPGDYTLNIPVGASLSGSGTLSGGNAFTTENLTADMISVPTNLYYNGEDRTADITTELSGELDKGITICGQTFAVSGWTVEVSRTDDLHYTATYTNTDNSTTFQKTITLQQSGTTLDGAVKTYNGDTQTTTFTASDTITVKATPTATGEAPANSAMFAASFTGPGAGQMAVFVGDTQVSAPADKGADGTYTMTVSAADVLAAAGGPGTGITLTAKFVGNDNMADGAGTVDVSISAVAKIENGSTTTYVGNLDDAFKTENDGATITLLKDVTRATTLRIKINCTLDLNGHNIKSTNETCLSVASSFAVTIQGEGEIISEQSHALVCIGTVTLEGGTFTSNGENFAGVYANTSFILSVTGENVTIQNTGGGYGLAVNDATSVQLSAGKYSGAAGAISIVSGSLTLGGLLAHSGDTRYAYFDESGTTPFTGVLGNKSLTGTVTVKKCNHTGEGVCEYTPNEGAETHAMTCLACGYAGAAESCAYSDDYGHDETNHWQTCTLCGGKKTEAHGWVHQCTSATGIIRRSCDKCEIETVVGTVSITPDFSVTYGKTGSATLVCTAELADGYSLEPADSADNCWVLMALSDGKSWNLGRELEVKLPADLPAGEYWYDASPRLSYQGNNTIVKRFNVIGKVTVTPAPLTIKANDQTITYGGSIATGTDQVTPAGLVGGDTLESVTLEASSDQVAVADKTITPSAAVIKRGGEDVTANYNITYQPGTLTINRAQGTLTVPAGPVAKTFGDGQFLLGCSTNGDGKISYASSDENVASVSADGNVLIKGAGEAVITVSLADGTNYTGAESQEVRITVAKAAAPAIPGETRNYTYLNGSHGAVTIDVAGKLPKDRGETTYTAATTDGKGILSGVSMDQDGNLVYTVEANKAIGDTAVITVTAVMANYGDTAYAVTIELVEKKTVEPQDGGSVSVKDGCILTYGQTLSDLTLENVIFVEQGTQKQVEGTLAWSAPSHVPEVADRTAQWVFTPKDNEEYEQLTGTATITVVKATPDTEAPEAAAVTYHPAGTLGSVGLNGGGAAWTVGGSAVTVEGTWGWKELSAIPAVKNSGYTAVFTPKDTANYDTVERTVAVTVAKAEPYIATPPTAAQITYGDALDASALTGGTVQYSSSDGTAVTGSFAWKDGSIKPDSGSAAYTVVFTPADSTDYSSVETQVTLVTGKAENAPDMPPSAMNVARRFEKVGDVGLPEGWQWQDTDRDTALETGVPVTATAVYTGADRDNYRNVTVSVAITRADCDHEHTEIRNAVTATCQRKGYTGDTWCLDCGELLAKGTETDLADHSGGTATCIRGKVCQVCGTEYTGKDSANHMHTEIRGAIKAGCTSDGYTGDIYCTDCGAKTGSGRAVPAAGHDWHVTREEAATTTSEGRRIYTCSKCGQTREESIPKLPQPSHTHSYSPRETKAATCTENGVVTYSCSCGDSYTQNTAALGHSYRSEVTKQPTVSAEGVMTYTCGRCGHSYTRPIAKLPDTGTQQPGTEQPGDTEPGSGSTEETRPDTGIPFIKGEDGKTGWDVIRAEEEKAQEGSTINVDMNGTTVVPGDIFDSIRGRDITVTFDMGGGILWSVNGKEVITDKAGDIDFSVKTETNAIPVDIVNNVTGERYSIQISLAHEGEFGFTAVLSIGLGRENAGYTASLYYYNESTGELEFICSDEVAEDGTVSLAFTHASDYVIAIDKQQEESGNDTEHAQPEDQDEDSTGQTEESPQTGQAWRPWWLIVVGALVIIMGIGVFFVVRKKQETENS